jgi:hypothetical protein
VKSDQKNKINDIEAAKGGYNIYGEYKILHGRNKNVVNESNEILIPRHITTPLKINLGAHADNKHNSNGEGSGSGFAIAGFICSLIGLLFLPILFSTLGIIFSALGLKSSSKGLAIAGLVVGVVGLVLSLVLLAIIV